MNCPKCNKPVPANARFCGSCGQPIEAAAVSSAAAVPAAAVPVPGSPPPHIAASAGAHASAAASAAAGAASAAASKAWAAAAASAPGLLTRIKNIVLTPKTEWPVIAPEPTAAPQLFAAYVAPLAVLAAVIGFLRMSVFGVNTLGGSFRMPIGAGLTYTVVTLVSALIGVFIVGLIINGLAPTFSGQRDQRQALKVSAYSLTPAMLSSVLALSPILPTLLQFLAGCYGIFVLYLGLPVVMQAPKEKAFGYTASVVICTILVGVVFGMIFTFAHIGGARTGMFGGTAADRAAEQAVARDQGAATVGNAIGNMLGTDAKGKADLGAAVSNLAKAGEAQQPASNGAAPSSPSADASQNAPSAAAATGGLLTALGGALGGSNRVTPVDFKSLQAMLPASLPGMKRTLAEGENQGALGVKTSSAKADYAANDGSSMHVEIADISGVSGLMDLAGGLIQSTTSQSDRGFEKDVVVGGRTVHEKYDAPSKKGELSVIVAKRYSVDLSGSGVDMQALEQSLGQIDLSKLESMKDAGAQPK